MQQLGEDWSAFLTKASEATQNDSGFVEITQLCADENKHKGFLGVVFPGMFPVTYSSI